MKVVVDNLATDYTDIGKGLVMLCLHGWGDSKETFLGLTTALEASYRVICLDLPGFGQSELPGEAWDIGQYAKFVKDFCSKLSVKPSIIIGHSMGGRIAIKVSANNLLKPSELILLATAGIKESNTARNQAYKVVAKTGKAVSSLPGLKRFQNKLRAKLYQSAGSTDYLNAGVMKQTFAKVIDEDLQAEAAKISIPTLLVYGTKDTETPPRYGETFHKQMSGSVLKLIPNAGHFVHVDSPAEVTKTVKEFIQQ